MLNKAAPSSVQQVPDSKPAAPAWNTQVRGVVGRGVAGRHLTLNGVFFMHVCLCLGVHGVRTSSYHRLDLPAQRICCLKTFPLIKPLLLPCFIPALPKHSRRTEENKKKEKDGQEVTRTRRKVNKKVF